jgi:DNA-binding response OmpR family regulator
MVKSKDHSEVQLKKVFYIEKSDFLRSMMELALKAKGAEIYTVATLENNFYLLDDLLPDLILFDVETAQNYLLELSEYSGKAVLVGMGSAKDKLRVEGMVKNYLIKPLEAKNIADRILSLLD